KHCVCTTCQARGNLPRKECEEGFRFGIATRKTRRCDFLSDQHIFFFYSKSFQGSQGRAYLFNSVVNVGCGPAEERVLLTGLHAVADIYCENCKTTLGWKYEHAFESSQKYKEGKFIIELAHMIKDNGWD
uniref:Protein yippee-like n=1 Tax=Salmo trutta TaxID=8032 RepID=A0A674D883_SALTR